VVQSFADSLGDIEELGRAHLVLGGRRFTLTREFVEDLREQQMPAAIRTPARPLLTFHSSVDRVVGIENAARIYEAARHPKSFVSLD